jgi:1,4-alpha-glucan branching enzyme
MIKKEEKGTGKKREEKRRETGRDVEFTFHAPEAAEVYLTGEFNHWDTRSLPMKKDKDGVWKTTVRLPLGRHEYRLLADNFGVEIIPDVEMVPNPYGTHNFVIWVK